MHSEISVNILLQVFIVNFGFARMVNTLALTTATVTSASAGVLLQEVFKAFLSYYSGPVSEPSCLCVCEPVVVHGNSTAAGASSTELGLAAFAGGTLAIGAFAAQQPSEEARVESKGRSWGGSRAKRLKEDLIIGGGWRDPCGEGDDDVQL